MTSDLQTETSAFLAIISQFPTLVYTILLGVLCLYWLLVFIGLFEFEVTDFDLDLDIDIDADAEPEALSGLAGILAALGLNGVPLSLVLSLLVLFSWLFSYFAASYLLVLVPAGFWQLLASSVTLLLALLLALPITVRVVRPIKKLFVVHHAVKKADFIGMRCEIRTSTVSEEFGQALVEDGEAGVLLAVRADTPSHLGKGDFATIVAYDAENETYRINPETTLTDTKKENKQ